MDEQVMHWPARIVAKRLGINKNTLLNMGAKGEGPPRIRVSPSIIRYPIVEYLEWEKSLRAQQ
jgi:hypothetical protein